MPDPLVAIDPSMAHHFRLDAWDALDDGGRLALGDHLAERLQAHGWDVPEPMTLGSFGPPDSPRSVLQWREPASGMTFSMVPGGTFRPGYDEARLARIEAFRREDEIDLDDPEEEARLDPIPLGPGQIWPFASVAPCDLRLKDPVDVPPLFMATELVRRATPGLLSVVTTSPWLVERDVIQVRWPQVVPILRHYGWALPTSAEFEWALKGGVDSLFYWCDDRPFFMIPEGSFLEAGEEIDRGTCQAAFDEILSDSFDPDRPRSWPWCNRFGLVAMLPMSTWCEPSAEPNDPSPFILRGGAGDCYPWQGCGEWMLMLTAVEGRRGPETKYASDGAIRPVVRLEAGA